MNLLAKVGWTALTLLLSAVLVGAASSPALAEGRGNSGLPSGPGNPVAKLQQEINALTQRFAELAQLGQSVAESFSRSDRSASLQNLSHLQ